MAAADEILVCEWPDQPDIYVNVEHYTTQGVAASGCHATDDWTVGGTKYGRTGYTAGPTHAERWWCYDDVPFVINLTGPTTSVQSLAEQLVFRSADEMRTGHS